MYMSLTCQLQSCLRKQSGILTCWPCVYTAYMPAFKSLARDCAQADCCSRFNKGVQCTAAGTGSARRTTQLLVWTDLYLTQHVSEHRVNDLYPMHVACVAQTLDWQSLAYLIHLTPLFWLPARASSGQQVR